MQNYQQIFFSSFVYTIALFVQQTFIRPAISLQHCNGKFVLFGLHFVAHPRHALSPSVSKTIWAHIADFVISSLNKSETNERVRLENILEEKKWKLIAITFATNSTSATNKTLATISFAIYLPIQNTWKKKLRLTKKKISEWKNIYLKNTIALMHRLKWSDCRWIASHLFRIKSTLFFNHTNPCDRIQ